MSDAADPVALWKKQPGKMIFLSRIERKLNVMHM